MSIGHNEMSIGHTGMSIRRSNKQKCPLSIRHFAEVLDINLECDIDVSPFPY